MNLATAELRSAAAFLDWLADRDEVLASPFDDLILDENSATIPLGTGPITLPAPLSDHHRTDRAERRRHAAAAGESRWPFPGGAPGLR